MRRLSRLTCVLLFAPVGAVVAQPTAVALGFLPGQDTSSAAACSADGRVVVGWSGNGTNSSAFRWGSFSGMHLLGSLPGATSAAAHDVSDDGSAACGWCIVGGQMVAVRWGGDSQPFSLGVLPGGTWSQALGMSTDGTTIVGQADDAMGQHAVVWTSAQGLRPLPDMAGQSAYVAVAVRGTSTAGMTEQGTGVRWTGLVAPTLLNQPAGSLQTLVFDVDGTGRILGGDVSVTTIELPTRWTGIVPAGSGTVDGFYTTGSPDGLLLAGLSPGATPQSFVSSTSVGGTKSVSQILVAAGASTLGFDFNALSGVSADGKVLVGTGWRNEHREAWVVRLPGAVVGCTPDMGVQGGGLGQDGHLDNNDFVAFINLYFVSDARADIGVQGALPGHDARYDNNDFIVFIDQFFSGCP